MVNLQILQEWAVIVRQKRIVSGARKRKVGDAGDRTRDLMHAKHALYH